MYTGRPRIRLYDRLPGELDLPPKGACGISTLPFENHKVEGLRAWQRGLAHVHGLDGRSSIKSSTVVGGLKPLKQPHTHGVNHVKINRWLQAKTN